jgi:hypothetical protein
MENSGGSRMVISDEGHVARNKKQHGICESSPTRHFQRQKI